MGENKVPKVKRHRGRQPVPEEALMDARFSMQFPRSREQDLRKVAFRSGLNVSAYMRMVILTKLDDELGRSF